MPRFQVHKDIKQLPRTVDAFLEADPAINNIPLGVLTRIRDMPEAFTNFQIFVVSEQETILAYAHHIPPYPLILSNCSQESLSLLANALREQSQPLPALHGQRSLVERFLECWLSLGR
jgi:hypothetical protein